MASSNPSIWIPAPSRGLRTNISHRQAFPAYAKDLQNLVYRDGKLRTRPNLSGLAQTTAGEDPMTFIQFRAASGTMKYYAAGKDGIYNFAAGAWSVLNGGTDALTGTYRDRPVFRIFDVAGVKWVLLTNGANAPVANDPSTTTYAAIGGSPPRARCMAICGDHVILFHLLSGGVISGAAYDCSAALSFTTGWGGAVQRGILQGTNGTIVAAQEMGSQAVAIYTEDGIQMMMFQGGVSPFRIELKAVGIPGPANVGAVAPLPDGSHAYLGRDFMPYIFDGIYPRPLSPDAQAFLSAQISPHGDGILDTTFVVFEPKHRLFWIFYPQAPAVAGDYPGRAIALDVDSGDYYPMRFDHTNGRRLSGGAAIDPQAISGIVEMTLGDSNAGWTSILNNATLGSDTINLVSTGISQFVQTGIYGGDAGRTFGQVVEIEHFFTPVASGTVVPSLVASRYGESPVASPLASVALDSGPFVSGVGRTFSSEFPGRFFGLRFVPGASNYFEWEASVASGVLRGER